MQLTPNFRLRKPDGTDPVDVKDLNDNMDVLDTEVAKKMDKTGDASNAVAKFSQAGSRTNLTSGEKLSLSLGKAMKWFADLKTVAFSGNYADLTGRPTIPAGGIADASKVIDDIDDIAANTQAGYMAGALALKKVNQNLGGLNFKEEAGKKYVRGADAVWVPLGNKNLVLMDGNDSYAYVGNSNGYYANFVLSNFDFSGFSKISIRNLSSYSYQVTCGPKVFTSDGTYDISDLDQAKLQVFYRGTNNNGNPPIQIRIELIP